MNKPGGKSIFFIALLALMAGCNGDAVPPNAGGDPAPAAPLAFPSAAGGGAEAVGGRGGLVYQVTNLNDSGPGSLRYGLTAPELQGRPRTIVFRVAGYLHLQDTLVINNDAYLTIAGQTAPADGVTIVLPGANQEDADKPLLIVDDSHDVIIRYLAFRKGGLAASDQRGSATAITGGSHQVVFDHLSISWGGDENLAIWSTNAAPAETPHQISVQWSIIAENLWNDGHSTGLIAGSEYPEYMTDVSVHHDFFARNNNRNPLLKGRSGEMAANLVYNWRWWASGVSGGIAVDVVDNFYKAGPARLDGRPAVAYKPYSDNDASPPLPGEPSIYFAGNAGPNHPDPASDGWSEMTYLTEPDGWGYADGVRQPIPTAYRRSSPRQTAHPVPREDAGELGELLLADGGAGSSRRLQADGSWALRRDQVDDRIIEDYRLGRGDGLLESVDDAGGWPYWTGSGYAYASEANFIAHPDLYQLRGGEPYADIDQDGMADAWEEARGLNPHDGGDGVADGDGDGYTNLEEFLNGTDPGKRDDL